MINHEIVIPPSVSSPAADCIKNSDVSIANSKAVLASMKAMYPKKTIKVIPFLTAITSVPPPKPRPEIGNKTMHIGYMGRLEARKRPDKLVKEWEQIVRAQGFGEAILHIYGDDAGIGMLDDLRQFVEEKLLSAKVVIHGRYQHSEVPLILSKLDLVVLPSEWEGLPLVLVEAMQHGVPFVATCAGGTSELQENNPHVLVTGLEWESFVDGLVAFVRAIRAKPINNCSLHDWVEQKYGFTAVWPSWKSALTDESREFWK
jgi:glycosyltransferase involved in cell wall biosynthesis